MKPLLQTVVAISLLLAVRAHPENIEDVKELPQTKEPIVEAEESKPQKRLERCSTCGPLNIKSPKEVLAALQALPGAEVHTQQSFEGCSSEKGCAGVKVKDGQVVQRYGNANAFKAAEAADTSNEFNFLTAGTLAANPFWWMNQDGPFKNGNFEKFSKSSFSSSSSGGLSGALNLAANPFLNGDFSNVATKPNFQSSSSSFESSYSSKGDLDLAKNPFLNGGFKAGASGAQNAGAFGVQNAGAFGAQTAGTFGAQNAGAIGAQNAGFGTGLGQTNLAAGAGNYAAGSNSFGAQSSFSAQGNYGASSLGGNYAGSGVRPIGVGGSNVNLVQTAQKASDFDFSQQTQQNIDELFQGSGNVDTSGGDLQQTCAGQGYICVPRAQCNNGVVNSNGANIPQANTKKQYCSISTEICCRLEVATVNTFGQTNLFQSNKGIGTNVPTPNIIETDSYSAGSENNGIYRPGVVGLKPGIPYLPPIDNTNQPSNIIPSTFPPPIITPRPLPPRPTTIRPITPIIPITSTAAPGYLPPIGEQTINRETIVPPNPNYIEGSLYLDQNRPGTTRQPVPVIPNDTPAGCAAALKCTPIEFCTAEGVISNTTVILSRDQDAYRVPLTDCRDIETGRIGKCCRDPFYTDPWPTNQLGKWVPGVFGGNDGKYVPDSRGSANNVRPVTPPTTGSVIFGNFRTTPKPTAPTGFATSPVSRFPTTAIPFIPKPTPGVGQFTKGGQGQFTKGGQGQFTKGGQGQFTKGGQGQIGAGSQVTNAFSRGQGQIGVQGIGAQGVSSQGAIANQGFGTQLNGGQGQLGVQGIGAQGVGGQGQLGVQGIGAQGVSGQGQLGVQGIGAQGVGGQGQLGYQGIGGQGQFGSQGIGAQGAIGQGQFGSQGQGLLVSQGQGEIVSQGQGQLVSQGEGQLISQGQGQFGVGGQGQFGVGGIGQYETQGQGQQGFGVINQASGLSKASGQLVSQSQGKKVTQGQGQKVTQGQGQKVTQGIGQYVTNGQGTIVSQGGGAYIEQGQGEAISQGFGSGIRQGQGFAVSQGNGFGVENEYGESVQRVFLQRYNGDGKCGLLNPQRPYGNKADLEVDFAEIPWQAMVLLQTNKSLLCGGVITRPDVVVTSAACVEGLEAKNVLIKGGEWKLGIDDEPLPFQIVQVKHILRHPLYKPGSLLYDAAVLVLTENLRLSKNINPICLPSSKESVAPFYNGVGECIVTGWGKIVLQAHLEGAIMHSLNVSLINPGECKAKLSSDYPHLLEQYNEDSCVCGQPTNPLNNICKVDIGSALACTTGDGRYVMQGVYSWDSGCQVGNQIASFYKFDLEWYEWSIGLIESVRFAQFTTITTGKITGFKSGVQTQFGQSGVNGQFGSQFGSGVKTQFGGASEGSSGIGFSGVKGFAVSGKGQYGFEGAGQSANQAQFSAINQFGKFGAQNFESGFNSQINSPINKAFSASYSEKKVFQTEPKIITYTTKPEIVTFTTKPEIFTFTTKPKIVTYTTKPKFITYTTKPKIITYTTKPQIITYETSGSGNNPQYVAPGVTFNPNFSDLIGHKHDSQCKCAKK
ncbi:uncharacterized protein LOC123717446 isoform X3 [Pieris brassicae]|uniref:uncharacterized protein LOC123717446 isoform X3 n=1 Tax=Pieris brassicae TaxID=7116 RepID=UPI001E65E2AE|nr:uncharacterized protein LOC123717446 isoform X3 [Pieris brassicae]